MPDLESIVLHQKFKWIQLYLNNHKSNWKFTMEEIVHYPNLGMFLQGNYDPVTKCYSIFYTEVLKSKSIILKRLEIDKQINSLYYNKDILIDNKVIYDEILSDVGICKIGDLFNKQGEIIKFSTFYDEGLTLKSYLTWRAIVNIVKNIDLKSCETNLFNFYQNDKMHDLLAMKCKSMCRILCKQKLLKSKAMKKIQNYFSICNDILETAFLIPRYSIIDNVIKDMQFKILHMFLPTNHLLMKMKKSPSDKCLFCGLYKETIYHLFYDCVCTKNFLKQMFSYLERSHKF